MAAIYHYTLIHGTGTTKSHRHSLTSCDMFIFSNHQYSIIKVLLRKRFISSISIPSVSPVHNSSKSLPVFYCIPGNNRLYIPYAIPAADHCTDHCHSRLRPPAPYALKVHLSDHSALYHQAHIYTAFHAWYSVHMADRYISISTLE